jgi:hypothetical protein
MKTKPTIRQQSSVACPTWCVVAGKRCVLAAGRFRKRAAPGPEALGGRGLGKEKNQDAIIKGPVTAPKAKERDSYIAILARLRKQAAKPYLTKSVREKATKKQIASWNAGWKHGKHGKHGDGNTGTDGTTANHFA